MEESWYAWWGWPVRGGSGDGRQPRTVPKVPVNKTFRVLAPDQMLLLPLSLDEWLPEDHLVRFVAELVDSAQSMDADVASVCDRARC